MHKVHMHAVAIMQLLYGLSSRTYVWGAVLVFIPYLSFISFMDIHNSYKDIHKLILDIHKSFLDVNKSVEYWISINRCMDIQ